MGRPGRPSSAETNGRAYRIINRDLANVFSTLHRNESLLSCLLRLTQRLPSAAVADATILAQGEDTTTDDDDDHLHRLPHR